MKIDDAIELLPNKDIIINIDGVFFPLDPLWKKISINVSGGADSAMLSYLLLTKIIEKKLDIEIHIISNIRMWKSRPWQKFDSLNVFIFLKEKFPSLKIIRHENFIAPDIEYGNIGPIIKDENGNMKSGDQISTRAYVEYFTYVNNIDAHFAGLSKNPTNTKISLSMPDRNVEFKNFNDLNLIMYKHNNTMFCHPYRFITKDWIIKKYKELNLLNFLNLTRSCEGDNNSYPDVFNGLDYKNYQNGIYVPECGRCFWCQERSWAKGMNNIK